ncbi:MAG: hypothetical protein AB9M60_24035 [Leptothrix sp. (in: b-proteobacteria)]
MQLSKTQIALAAALFTTSSTLFAATCTVDPATPFTSGPADPVSKFPQWIVDSNGVGLNTCLDSVDGQGNPPPCIYVPPVAGNSFSQAIGRGTEAFYFLATSVFNTTGPAAVDAVIVMGVESAFLTPEPVDGYQTQFQRLRIRVNVNATGIYTVEHPWGKKTYTVDTLLPPGNGQNRSEISDPTDVSFAAGTSVPGMVAPFLKWDPAIAPAASAGYLGDGITPHTVIGSPCGANFVRVTAVALDGVTPIAIDPTDADGDGSTSSYTSRLFTVQGKLLPTSITPLSVGNAYYSRTATATTINVMAQSAPDATVTAAPAGAAAVVMTTDGKGRFYSSTLFTGATLPTSVRVTANSANNVTQVNDQPNLPLRDLVTISRAQATCTARTQTCSLVVNAASSDVTGAPMLTLSHTNTALVNGAITVSNATALPGEVTVMSAAGGSASLPVTVINQ